MPHIVKRSAGERRDRASLAAPAAVIFELDGSDRACGAGLGRVALSLPRRLEASVTFPTNEQWDAQRDGVRQAHRESIAELNRMLIRTDAAFTETRASATHTELEDAVIGHWARATAVSIGLRHLCELVRRLGLDSEPSLAELLASAAWLLVVPEERDERARKFTRFVDVELEDQARLAERIGHPPDVVQAIRDQIAPVVSTEPPLSELFRKPRLGWTQFEPPGTCQ